ncbi:MAG: ATP-binding protein [Campylobacterota bacterium]|nr:ATP-binding protein [Campylobacterota bacterium]
MKKTSFYITFILVTAISFFVLNYEKNQKIEYHLELKTKQYSQNYNLLYNEYKKISTIIYKTKVDTKIVNEIFKDAYSSSKEKQNIIREKLYSELEYTYNLLKESNIKQLHFHLPNNESFLRFHRPNKYGDNLTDIRATVKYVNETKKPIDGFEEGRIYNGYRFVFPMFYENKHIGSVEISFSTLAMNKEFIKNFNIIGKFLISKDIVKNKVFKDEKSNYKLSQFEQFYFEKKINTLLQIFNKNNLSIDASNKTKQIVKERWMENGNFSVFDTKSNSIMTFLKVQNPISNNVVSILIIRSDARYINNKINNFYLMLFAVTLFLLLSTIYIYKVINDKKRLNILVEEKTNTLNTLNRELEESEEELKIVNENLEIQVQKEVSKNREKDKILFEQTKMAALGEMIGNIAHQWRQPLSVISSISSGMIIQKEMNVLEDDIFIKNCNDINKNAQYLSKTIDDFRNFIRGESKKEFFNLKNTINSFLNLVTSSIDTHCITVDVAIEDDINIFSLQNELNQCFINLFNNSKDVLSKQNIEKYIYIGAQIKGEELEIVFKDNGGGIPNNIIDKIFEPYFTTKHQSQGTGLGLNMTYRLIVEGMGGTISVMNNRFEFNNNKYNGAEFIIKIPLK